MDIQTWFNAQSDEVKTDILNWLRMKIQRDLPQYNNTDIIPFLREIYTELSS